MYKIVPIFLLAWVWLSGFTLFDFGKKEYFSGQIETKNSYIGSKVGGRVEAILKNEGDFVKKGDVILIFESSESKLKLEAIRAKAKSLESNLKKLKSGYQKEEIAVAKAEFDAKHATFDNAKKNLERQEQLVKSSATSQREFDDAKNRFLEAKAQREASLKKLELYTSGYRYEDIESASALLDETLSNMGVAQIELQESKILSPLDGKIQKISVHIGDLVQKSQPVIEVASEAQKYAKFYVPETKLHTISLGQKVEIGIDGGGERFDGEIFFISESAEFTPKNITTKDERENQFFAIKAMVSSDKLKSGMIIEVTPK